VNKPRSLSFQEDVMELEREQRSINKEKGELS
jgi:hypothetical protein